MVKRNDTRTQAWQSHDGVRGVVHTEEGERGLNEAVRSARGREADTRTEPGGIRKDFWRGGAANGWERISDEWKSTGSDHQRREGLRHVQRSQNTKKLN